jgi:hypothetical protein
VPLYERSEETPHTSLDLAIAPDETTLGRALHAAFWNARPISASDLGSQVGEAGSDTLLSDLRDAYLRLADPTVSVPPGRLGPTRANAAIREWRESERRLWQPLTGRVLSAPATASDPANYLRDVVALVHNESFHITFTPQNAASLYAELRETGEHLAVFNPALFTSRIVLAGPWHFNTVFSVAASGAVQRMAEAPFAQNFLDQALVHNMTYVSTGFVGGGTVYVQANVGPSSGAAIDTASRGGTYAGAA